MEHTPRYLTTTKAGKYFGVSRDTLAKWELEGRIQCYRTKPGYSGHKRYDVNSFKGTESSSVQFKPSSIEVKLSSPEEKETSNEKGVCYCRVSTRSQADDLNRQAELMQQRFPTFKIIKDFGSGINFKRKGLLRLLEGAIERNYSTVVVSHRDRLTRFGFELFEWLFSRYGIKLLVLEPDSGSKKSELCKDLLSIIHVFSCRANGARRYKKKEPELSSEEKEESTEL